MAGQQDDRTLQTTDSQQLGAGGELEDEAWKLATVRMAATSDDERAPNAFKQKMLHEGRADKRTMMARRTRTRARA